MTAGNEHVTTILVWAVNPGRDSDRPLLPGSPPPPWITPWITPPGFIIDRTNRGAEGCEKPLTITELGGKEDELYNPEVERLGACLRQIGDELDSNVELQRMIENIGNQCPKEMFFRVAKEQFADGVINWGRVVTLFYFACKLVVKAFCQKIPELIQTIIGWTMEYIQENILRWIRDHGGWEAILGTPTWQAFGIFTLGVITTLVVVRWKSS
ncbi:apoptosis regulator BAX-like [Stegostoma tigrinum]|uniref:apoptosis regulator BAX-like n=1 Tax=Stegostoma tigrinum TaxID=3053191 RepID=UPI00286FCB95|nr:apoptosis regulator BAX-like [Stegostoma tigrinum]